MPALVEQWLSRLGGLRPSWFEANAPQQSATPAPGYPVPPGGQPFPVTEPTFPATNPPPGVTLGIDVASGPETPPWLSALGEMAPVASHERPGLDAAWGRAETIGAPRETPITSPDATLGKAETIGTAYRTGRSPLEALRSLLSPNTAPLPDTEPRRITSLPTAGRGDEFLARVRTLPEALSEFGLDFINPDLPGPAQAGTAAIKAGREAWPLVTRAWSKRFATQAAEAGVDPVVAQSAHDLVDRTIELFKAHPDVLPLEGGRGARGRLKAFRKNADFEFTLDVNRICKRVAQYWNTVGEVEAKLTRKMTPDELLYLGQAMRRDGDIPGCIFCYVESSRRNKAMYASKFTTMTREQIASEMPKAKLNEWAAQRDALLQQAGWSLEDLQRVVTSPATMQDVLEQGGPGAQVVRLYGQYALASQGTALTGNGTYLGEILRLKPEQIASLNGRAGLRWWSATDFDPTQAVETLKAMSDSSVRGLAGHGYTKEPYAALIFGETGMKINTSVAVNKVGGKFVSDDVNGMPLDVAKRLRTRYPNVGTMLVAKNLEQLEWGLKSGDIDMMIPHHAAYWEGGSSRYGIFGLDDFSDVQHERWVNPKAAPWNVGGNLMSSAKKTPADVYGAQLHFKHWLDEAKGDEQQAVRLYLKFCESHGIVPRFGRGTYISGATQKTEIFPGYTDSTGYAKLLKDYARTDSALAPVDVSKVDERRLRAYVETFAGGGGWPTEPRAKTVDRVVARLQRGQPLDLKAEEQRLLSHPPSIATRDSAQSLGIKRWPQRPANQASTGAPAASRPWRSTLREAADTRLREIAQQQDEITRRIDAIERGAPRVSSRVSWEQWDQKDARDAWLDSAPLKELQAEYAALNAKRREVLAQAKKAARR